MDYFQPYDDSVKEDIKSYIREQIDADLDFEHDLAEVCNIDKLLADKTLLLSGAVYYVIANQASNEDDFTPELLDSGYQGYYIISEFRGSSSRDDHDEEDDDYDDIEDEHEPNPEPSTGRSEEPAVVATTSAIHDGVIQPTMGMLVVENTPLVESKPPMAPEKETTTKVAKIRKTAKQESEAVELSSKCASGQSDSVYAIFTSIEPRLRKLGFKKIEVVVNNTKAHAPKSGNTELRLYIGSGMTPSNFVWAHDFMRINGATLSYHKKFMFTGTGIPVVVNEQGAKGYQVDDICGEIIGNNVYVFLDPSPVPRSRDESEAQHWAAILTIVQKAITIMEMSKEELDSYILRIESVTNQERALEDKITASLNSERERLISDSRIQVEIVSSLYQAYLAADERRKYLETSIAKLPEVSIRGQLKGMIEKVKELPLVRAVYIRNCMTIETAMIYCQHPKTKHYHEIGEFIILFDFNAKQVRWYNMTRRVYGVSTDMNAPHVYSDGRACLGDAQNTFTALFDKMDLVQLVLMSISFIQSVNIHDAAGSYINRWPIAKEMQKDGNYQPITVKETQDSKKVSSTRGIELR